MTTSAPRLSVAVPLHRSGPFVDNIITNLERIRYAPLEVLISDRHGLDDAVDRLECWARGDARVRILRSRDCADWVTHYNDLLRAATGTYFCWMPHDDDVEPGYVERLVAGLEARPEAILAFGVMEAVGVDRDVPVQPFTPPPIAPDEPWTAGTAMNLLRSWELFRVVRGVMRRERVVSEGLFVPRVHGTVRADVCWAFALAVTAPFVFVPDARCTKRYRVGSASDGWHYGVRAAVDECRVMCRALWRSPAPRPVAARQIAALLWLAARRVAWRAANGRY